MAQLLQNAAYGTALILAAALLRQTLKDRLLPGARLILWAVCLLRLLTPVPLESALSLWGLFRPQQASAPTPAPASQLYTPAFTSPAPSAQPAPAISWEAVLPAAWLMVGLALAVRYVLSWTRTRRAVACAIPVERGDPRYAPLPKCARLREGPMEGAPLTFGAVKPTVVLTPGLEGDALDCVLVHEGVHAQRRDNLWHYAMALALAVHWWNPAVWLMARLLRRDIELSCDRAALKKLGENRRADYANALLSLATQADSPAFCQTFGRKAAEERILSVMKFKKTSVIGVIFSLALVLAVTAAFASEPKTPEAADGYDTVRTGTTGTVWVPDVDATKDIQSDFPEVDPDDVDLSMMRDQLAQKVADGKLTQEEADKELARVKELLEQARRGAVKLFMYTDDQTECYLYGSGVGKMYYRDEDGTLTPFDPGSAVNGYEVKLPTFDGDGGEPAGVIGSHFYSYEIAGPEDGAAAGGEAVPVPSASLAKGFDGYSIVGYDENGYPVAEDGSHLMFDENGALFLKFTAGYAPCIKEDCTIAGAHYHKDGEVVPCSESNAPTPVFEPALEYVPLSSPYCPVCTETRLHQHVDGQTVLLPDPCPVEGCTITGCHDHNGVSYSCGGAGHEEGHCDGSCYTYSASGTASTVTATSTHHSESHHGESHHGSHH